MSEERAEGGRARKNARRRGLGRGLSALIPEREEPVAPQRPLDILFPKARGAEQHERGGSARDLLAPRRADVSRETSPERPEGSATGRRDVPARAGRERSERARPGERRDLVQVPGATFGELRIEWIIPNTRQPRRTFDEDELRELADSISEVGVLQPIVVRPIDAGAERSPQLLSALREHPEARYELIVGERRWRAAGMAGLKSVPAVVRRTSDDDLLRDALLENLHRTQLNPLEEAAAYQQLLQDFGCTQEELSGRIARSRSQIANTLRLLRLPPTVQGKVAAGVLSAGHARALLSLGSAEDMERLAERIVAEGMSVRGAEEAARLVQTGAKTPRRRRRAAAAPVSETGRRVVDLLSDLCETRVTIHESARRGRIVIEYAGSEDLQRLAGIIGKVATPAHR